ncbi:unnamed protein product [Ectocarpus sp. 4 AP-2014]
MLFSRFLATSVLAGNLTSLRAGTLRETATMSASDSNPYGMKWHRSMLRLQGLFCVMTLQYRWIQPSLSLVNGANVEVWYSRELFSYISISPANFAHARLLDMQNSCAELEHEHGVESDPDLVYSSGNDEPYRGFGRLASLTADVYKANEELEMAGVSFKKKSDEGRMKGLAFGNGPSGYWVELVRETRKLGTRKNSTWGRQCSVEGRREIVGVLHSERRNGNDQGL